MLNLRCRNVLLVLGAGVVVCSVLPPRRARAEAAEDPVTKVTQLNRDAITAYQANNYEEARRLLKQALDLAGLSGLDQHPIKARTHVHMAMVIIVGFKQREVGMKQFHKALEIQPDIGLTKGLVTPELQEAFDQVAAEVRGVAPPAPPPAPPAAGPETPSGLVHEAVSEGRQGSAISIAVGVQNDLKFEKLVLAYRPEGASDFLGREMKRVSEGTYAAEIPTTATLGRSVAYYVEAEDRDGGPVAARGSAERPLVIALGGTAGPVVQRSAPEDEDDEEDEDDTPRTRLFIGLLVGSGAGWATGTGDTNADVMIKPAGFALSALGQFAPEVGYWIRPNLMISLQGRFQKVSGTTDIYTGSPMMPTIYHTANFATAVFAKATWRFGGDAKLHPFFSLAAGGGQIRHVVEFRTLTNCGLSRNEVCKDTIAAGPVVVGPGGGIFFDINEHFGLVLQLNTQLAFPDFTFNVDGNGGVGLRF